MRVANVSNGLYYPPYDSVAMFLSTYGHHKKSGYFNESSMPWDVVIHLLKGNNITFIDGTKHNKSMPDSVRYGLGTWVMVFNRAIRRLGKSKNYGCPWATHDMKEVALHSNYHIHLKKRIRKIMKIVPATEMLVIGKQIKLEIHKQIKFDDKPHLIKDRLERIYA